MAVIVKTSNPHGLLEDIKDAIKAGKIETCSYDTDGDFTHIPDQWNNKAWLIPKTGYEELRFGILAPKGVTLSKAVYGVYHGRFIEMLLTHFDDKFSDTIATAKKSDPDAF